MHKIFLSMGVAELFFFLFCLRSEIFHTLRRESMLARWFSSAYLDFVSSVPSATEVPLARPKSPPTCLTVWTLWRASIRHRFQRAPRSCTRRAISPAGAYLSESWLVPSLARFTPLPCHGQFPSRHICLTCQLQLFLAPSRWCRPPLHQNVRFECEPSARAMHSL